MEIVDVKMPSMVRKLGAIVPVASEPFQEGEDSDSWTMRVDALLMSAHSCARWRPAQSINQVGNVEEVVHVCM